MNSGRRRRRISPYRRIASTVGWALGAAVVLAIALIATGRSVGTSLAVAAAGAAVVTLVVGALELTGALRTAPPEAGAQPDVAAPDDDESASEGPRP